MTALSVSCDVVLSSAGTGPRGKSAYDFEEHVSRGKSLSFCLFPLGDTTFHHRWTHRGHGHLRESATTSRGMKTYDRMSPDKKYVDIK